MSPRPELCFQSLHATREAGLGRGLKLYDVVAQIALAETGRVRCPKEAECGGTIIDNADVNTINGTAEAARYVQGAI